MNDSHELTKSEIAAEIAAEIAERAEREALCQKLWGTHYTRELSEALNSIKTEDLIDYALF
jgi:hypothetical protein